MRLKCVSFLKLFVGKAVSNFHFFVYLCYVVILNVRIPHIFFQNPQIHLKNLFQIRTFNITILLLIKLFYKLLSMRSYLSITSGSYMVSNGLPVFAERSKSFDESFVFVNFPTSSRPSTFLILLVLIA